MWESSLFLAESIRSPCQGASTSRTVTSPLSATGSRSLDVWLLHAVAVLRAWPIAALRQQTRSVLRTPGVCKTKNRSLLNLTLESLRQSAGRTILLHFAAGSAARCEMSRRDHGASHEPSPAATVALRADRDRVGPPRSSLRFGGCAALRRASLATASTASGLDRPRRWFLRCAPGRE